MSLDYRPDWPPGAGILQGATHVIPDVYGDYRTSLGASVITNWNSLTMANTVYGARIVRKGDGTPFLFAGINTDLYEVNGSTLTVATRAAGGSYAATATNRWWFCQLGDETLACNGVDVTQTRSGATGTKFANHATAPKAKIMVAQSGHVLALNYNDGSASPNGIKWASQGSSANWTAATGNSAGSATLVETPGEITAAAPIHDIVVVWKRNSMYTGKRVGGQLIWQFNSLSQQVGCPNTEAWVSTPVGIIFASTSSGIYKFDGSSPVPIDRGIRYQIYKTFASSPTVLCSHDEASSTVYFWNGISTNTAWAYNYLSDKWSVGYNSSLGNSSISNMMCTVRDSKYDDYITLGGLSNLQRRAHLIVGSNGILYNLSSLVPANNLNASFTMPNVRHQNASPRDDTTITRVNPIFNSSIEQTYYEPTSGTLSHFAKDRPSASPAGTGQASLDSMKGFDLLRTCNTHYLQMDFTNEALVMSDVVVDMKVAGRR